MQKNSHNWRTIARYHLISANHLNCVWNFLRALNQWICQEKYHFISINVIFLKHRPSGPMLSISRFVRLSVCMCVCLFTFEVPFKRLFVPTSQSQMSNIFMDSESLGFKKKMDFWVFLVHPPMALVLLSALVERCFVSRMRDFFSNISHTDNFPFYSSGLRFIFLPP